MDHYAFKTMISEISKAGQGYKIPTRRHSGVSANRNSVTGQYDFGRVLKNGLDIATTSEKAFLESIVDIGGSLCIDGAKNFKRSALNAIEVERTTVPEEAIVEPYSEVEDVAGNMLIDLLLKDSGI